MFTFEPDQPACTPAQSQGAQAASYSSDAANQTPPVRTTYARPLNEAYGTAYRQAQAEREEQAKQLLLQRKAKEQADNTVQVLFWAKVCYFILKSTF